MDEIYYEQIEKSKKDLFEKIAHRFGEEDMKRIQDACALATEAHSHQFRKSGEPYIAHPIAVARIVATELELGANPIIAAFLHDVVEDTHFTIDDIRQRFGDDVAFLVGVVTKPKKEKYEKSKQVDNYRQILASVEYDIRALLLKLADRLHNMRTLDSMAPDKQMKIAGETDYFYAPFANRLGLYHVKTELENLSLKFRCPMEYAALEEQIEQCKLHTHDALQEFVDKINGLLRSNHINATTEVRYRMPCSVWRKMQSAGCDMQHVDGKHYIRIIYANPEEMSEKRMSLLIYSLLTDVFKERPGSVSNYIDAPKENGYQSFHVKLLNERGGWEEIHISSERMLRNSRLGCAAERTEENVKSWLKKFKAVLQDVAYHTDEIEFMEGVTSSFYNDDILVFTPQGMGIILPKGATALDFAFEIHSEIGFHAFCARINGHLSSLKTRLHRGDCIEIVTEPKSVPESDWLDHVMTYKAKCRLRSFLIHRKETDYQRCPYCHPIPGDEVVGFVNERGQTVVHKRNCKMAVSLASQQGDSIISVNFKEDEHVLYPVRIRIRAVDHYHLLSDLIDCITNQQQLSISRLDTRTIDHIAECSIDFGIHSIGELQAAIRSIIAIEGVDEVQRMAIE